MELPDPEDKGFIDVGDLSDASQSAIAVGAEFLPSRGPVAFEPWEALTRAELAIALVKLLRRASPDLFDSSGVLKLESGELDHFADARAALTAADNAAVSYAYELGIASGEAAGAFRPTAPVTREELAVMMTRAMAHTNARPAGWSAQWAGGVVTVSVRDGSHGPVVGVPVDSFVGLCDFVAESLAGDIACEIDDADPVTDSNGNVQIDASAYRARWPTVVVWSGDIGDTYDFEEFYDRYDTFDHTFDLGGSYPVSFSSFLPANLQFAEQWIASDCSGDAAVVVGSDLRAQSDIYSAVTLAGVLGTDCVVLAGLREGDMTPDQQSRLDASDAGGYVVGGIAAVPDAKVAGRDVARVAGATRWDTAQSVGSEARRLALGADAGTSATPGPAGHVPDDVAASGAYLAGAEPWIASDCAGDVAIVVGSDAKAQSDIYSAVTLAGALGTDCVVLAGPRDGHMAPSQRQRLEAAAAGGYVVGGMAAVPDAKVAGRDMTRVAGPTRWHTAHRVGIVAKAAAGQVSAAE